MIDAYRAAASRDCYGCQGTGRLRWAGVHPQAVCSCASCHGDDCDQPRVPRHDDEGRGYCSRACVEGNQ